MWLIPFWRSPPPKKRLEWSRFSIDEPLTAEMKTILRSKILKDYHSHRRYLHGQYARVNWASGPDLGFGMFTLDNPLTPLRDLRKFCNKATAMYWTQSAQRNDQCRGLIFACIYKEWFRYHHNAPNIEFGSFFANPIRITRTGPDTIAGILEAHKSLCEQAIDLLDNDRHGKASDAHCEGLPDSRNYKMLPLYRAIVVVIDQLAPDNSKPHQRGVLLDEVVQRQNVLMVLTGDEEGLSAPITFDSTRSQALPIATIDVTNDAKVIRVSLRTAVRFIADLRQKEEEAFPELEHRPIDESISPITSIDPKSLSSNSFDEWLDEIMRQAEEKGAINVPELKLAAWQMEAEQQGDYYPEPEFSNFSPTWV